MARVEAENGIKRPRAEAFCIRSSSGQGAVVLRLHVILGGCGTRKRGDSALDYLSDSLHWIVGYSYIRFVQRARH